MRFSRYVLCVRNEGNEASLEVRKIYSRLRDADAEAHGMIRVIDEDEEDYLYPASYFVPVEIPRSAERVLAAMKQRTTHAELDERLAEYRRMLEL